MFIDSGTMDTQVGVTLLPARFGAVAVGCLGVLAMLLAANVVPARRAATLDPARALKSE